MRAPRLVAAFTALGLFAAADAGAQAPRPIPVDLALILAVDISPSVDDREGYFQRKGYIDAFRNPKVLQAIRNGRQGRIAVTYVEWSGVSQWRIVAMWQVIGSAADAEELAARLELVPVGRGSGTSITSLFGLASTLFLTAGVTPARRVLDVSGDGPNSAGGILNFARDALVRDGVTINGLPILTDDGGNFNLPDLDVYYEECVIGGPGSFVIAADGFEAFGEAIQRKLILEMAGDLPAPLRAIPVQAVGPQIPGAKINRRYAPDCDIGEKLRYLDNPNIVPDGLRLPMTPLPPMPPR